MQFLDIHTHLQNDRLEIRSILSLSLTEDTLLSASQDQELTENQALLEKWVLPKNQDVSVGLHPWFATIERLEEDYSCLAEVAKSSQVKLIGECGLDRLKGEKLENQLIILKKQLHLAEEIQKPVILHCVKCFDELISVQKEMKLNIPLILHGFNKHEELGKQLLNQGFYLSFGKSILNANSGAAALLKHTNVFFLETDDADCSIAEIYEAAANLKNCTVNELKALIFANWKKIMLI